MKKFPVAVASSSVELPFSHVLIGLYRMRAGSDGSTDPSNKTLFNLIFRLTHLFAQCAEEALSNVLVNDCPDATIRERMHPYQAASRRKGNPALKLQTVNNFQARGGGFVSVKDEVSLHKLGILSKQSPFGSRTGSELCARVLGKTSQFLQEKMMRMDLKVLNFAFDAATCSGEHVPWFLSINSVCNIYLPSAKVKQVCNFKHSMGLV